MERIPVGAEASAFIDWFERSCDNGPGNRIRVINDEGETMVMPSHLVGALRQVIKHTRLGRRVVLVAEDSALTTQQAADFLQVSRPTLIKLLAEFDIGHTRVGRHRRINRDDVIQLRELLRHKRISLLNRARAASEEAGEYVAEGDPNPLVRT